jgi:hypothetical protein
VADGIDQQSELPALGLPPVQVGGKGVQQPIPLA